MRTNETTRCASGNEELAARILDDVLTCLSDGYPSTPAVLQQPTEPDSSSQHSPSATVSAVDLLIKCADKLGIPIDVDRMATAVPSPEQSVIISLCSQGDGASAKELMAAGLSAKSWKQIVKPCERFGFRQVPSARVVGTSLEPLYKLERISVKVGA